MVSHLAQVLTVSGCFFCLGAAHLDVYVRAGRSRKDGWQHARQRVRSHIKEDVLIGPGQDRRIAVGQMFVCAQEVISAEYGCTGPVVRDGPREPVVGCVEAQQAGEKGGAGVLCRW